MSEQSSEGRDESSTETTTGISDDQLPDDLVPGEDNPLAEGLDDGETAGDLFEDGKEPDQGLDETSDDTDDDESGDPDDEG